MARPHLDGIQESHESQAAEVHIQGVAQRPEDVVPRWVLAHVAHVDRGGAGWFAGRLAVGERGAVGGVVVRMMVRMVVHGLVRSTQLGPG